MKHDTEALGHLRAWMQSEWLKDLSPPVYGYFDPPWTLGFLRRNEVVLLRGEIAHWLRTR